MTLNRFNQTLTIKMKSSLSKQLFIVMPHVIIAVLMCFFMNLTGVTLFYLFISLTCILMSLIYFVRMHLTLNANKSICSIVKNSNGDWNLALKNSEVPNVLISTTSFVSNTLIILVCIDGFNNHYTALITPDSVNQDVFRRLKVHLKTSK